MTEITTRPAASSEWREIAELLETNNLPVDGAREHLDTYWVALDGSEVVGTIGIELYGSVALLRSAAVQASRRSIGVGRALVAVAIEAAASRGVEAVYLLTTTAKRYFAAQGFNVLEREQMPAVLQNSAELRGACPASAICMERRLA